jgi:EH domain-containing protein 1
MEIGQNPASGCSKEHQKIYQEWFALADSGPIHPPLSALFPFDPRSPLPLLLAWMRCGLIDGAADGDGRITGPDAIKFFGMSKLSRPDLKQVRAAPFLFCLAGGADDFFLLLM